MHLLSASTASWPRLHGGRSQFCSNPLRQSQFSCFRLNDSTLAKRSLFLLPSAHWNPLSLSSEQKEFNEGINSFPINTTDKITPSSDQDSKLSSLAYITSTLAVFLLAGLVSCPQAWAGPEIARIEDASWIGNLDEIKSGFVSAFLLIFFSEIGDKTFFIAAVLASRKSNVAVFSGTFGALVAMSFISVFLGRTFHYIDELLPFSLGNNELPLDDLAAAALLLYFGASTLFEAASMEGSKAEEEKQDAELAIAGLGGNGKGSAITSTALATFALVFVAEWGDKSFFSTIALSAATSPIGVVSGAVVGHGVATLLAVLGGSLLSEYVSEKVIAYTGGALFLVFAAYTLYEVFS